MFKRYVILTLLALASFYKILDLVASMHTLPGDLQNFWDTHMLDLSMESWAVIAVLSALALWVFFPDLKDILGKREFVIREGPVPGDDRSIKGNTVYSGVLNTGDVYQSKPKRKLSDATETELVRHIGEIDRVEVVSAMNDPEAESLGDQIETALERRGYKNVTRSVAVFSSPQYGVIVENHPDLKRVIVGHNE